MGRGYVLELIAPFVVLEVVAPLVNEELLEWKSFLEAHLRNHFCLPSNNLQA